jgi:hypothetical protein
MALKAAASTAANRSDEAMSEETISFWRRAFRWFAGVDESAIPPGPYTLTLNEIAAYELPPSSETELPASRRDQIMAKAVIWKIAHQGLEVKSRGEHQVVLTRRRWTGREEVTTLTVDEHGEVTCTRPGRDY